MFRNLFLNKYVSLWRLNTIGMDAVLLITFLFPRKHPFGISIT